MTDEEFEKWKPLVFKIYGPLKRYSDDPENLLQTGFEALLDAHRKYDPDRSKFTTYAYRVISTRLWRVLNKKRPVPAGSFAAIPVNNSSEKKFERHDFSAHCVNKLRRDLDCEEMHLLEDRANGKTYRQIGKELKVSSEWARRMVMAVIKKSKRILEREADDCNF